MWRSLSKLIYTAVSDHTLVSKLFQELIPNRATVEGSITVSESKKQEEYSQKKIICLHPALGSAITLLLLYYIHQKQIKKLANTEQSR